MIQHKIFFDFEKEEKWLEDMAMQGFHLVKAGSFSGYYFIPQKPVKSTIRIDYREFIKKNDFIEYCNLFKDSGWIHIAGTRYSGNQYFKKTGKTSSDEIFSDPFSKAGRYKRLANMWLFTSCFFLLVWFPSLSASGVINKSAFINPKELYYTPDLWERSGSAFWFGFLFETPFALARGYFWLLLVGIILLLFALTVKYWLLYRSARKDNL